MKREELQNKPLNELLEIGNNKYGQYECNSLVAREMSRMYNKLFNRTVIMSVKREAILRVLCGQINRENPFADQIILIKSDKDGKNDNMS